MSYESVIAELINAGTPAALVAKVAKEWGEAEAERAILAQRRQNERNRKAKSRDITGQDVTERDTRDSADSPSLSPTPPLSPQTPQSPPRPHTHPKPETRAHARRLPEDWEPEALTGESAAAVALWQPGRIERELSKFRDHFRGASGERARKHDWQATWRKWILKADEDGPRNAIRPAQGLRGSRPDPAIDLLRQARAELARSAEDQEPDSGAGTALPSYLTGRS